MENNMKNVVAAARTHAALHLQPPCCHFHHENAVNISMTPSGAFPSFLIKRIAQADDDFISWRELMPGHICRNQQENPPEKPWQLAIYIYQPNSAINQSINQSINQAINQSINQATNTFKITLLKVFANQFIHSTCYHLKNKSLHFLLTKASSTKSISVFYI